MKKTSKSKPNKALKKKQPGLPRSIKVSAPAAESHKVRNLGQPRITRVGDAGDCIVIHKEFVTDLVATTVAGAFSAVGIPINPANRFMFPWLSDLAVNFESYVFKALKFIFEPSVGTSTSGSVLMAVDYDIADDLPTDKSDMMSLRGATRSPPWCSNQYVCSKEDLRKRKTYFVNPDTEGSLNDQGLEGESYYDRRLDDVGELILASSNASASSQLGEFYVEYEVELMTPQAGDSVTPYFSWYQSNTDGPLTSQQPLGPAIGDAIATPFIYRSTPISVTVSGGNNRVGFGKPGTYLYTLSLEGVSITGGSSPTMNFTYPNTSTGLVFRNVNYDGGSTGCHEFGLVVLSRTQPIDSVTGAIGYFDLNVTPTSGTIVFTGGVVRLRIVEIPPYIGNVQGAPTLRVQNRSRRNKCLLWEPDSNVYGSDSSCSKDVAGKRHSQCEKESPRSGKPGRTFLDDLPLEDPVSYRCILGEGPHKEFRQGKVRVFDPATRC